MKGESSYLFAYGTLRDSNINHKAFFLQQHAVYVGRAFINAKLFKVTWYPAIILDNENQDKVFGDIFELPLASREMVLHELDGYEGIYGSNEESEEYERVIAPAHMDDGSSKDCWVYNYKGELHDDLRIRSGDYLKYLKEQY